MAEDSQVRIWCGCCGEHQPFEIERLAADDLNPGKGPWGDVVCIVCHFVMLTITAPEPGRYALVRVGD